MINVTKTYAPSLHKYTKYLEGIWERRWFTNHGPLVTELEDSLKSFLGVKHLFFVTNGTIALQIAIKALGLTGKVLTSPFSYVATTSSLSWEGCEPVFADIDPENFNISPKELTKFKPQDASGILGVHVYGNPCDVKSIEKIASKNNWGVIYDAAHAFNIKIDNNSVLNFGDISTLSFHSTKVFHTIEGGAIITNNDELAHKISYMRNFGHNGKESFFGVGVNGKCSEFQAAMGLCMLEEYPQLENLRKERNDFYNSKLKTAFETADLIQPVWAKGASSNFGYYPVLFKSEEALLQAKESLERHEIFPRRYFYPSLTSLPYVKASDCPIGEETSARMMCLPLYAEIKKEEQELISELLLKSLAKSRNGSTMNNPGTLLKTANG